MILSMPFKYYSSLLQNELNQPAKLDLLLKPFRLPSPSSPSSYLLVGHIIDELAQRLKPADPIDALDVATAALDLGYDEAEDFLDSGPYLMYQLVKEEGCLRL